MLNFRKELVASRVSRLDEIWFRVVLCELADSGAAAG